MADVAKITLGSLVYYHDGTRVWPAFVSELPAPNTSVRSLAVLMTTHPNVRNVEPEDYTEDPASMSGTWRLP